MIHSERRGEWIPITIMDEPEPEPVPEPEPLPAEVVDELEFRLEMEDRGYQYFE